MFSCICLLFLPWFSFPGHPTLPHYVLKTLTLLSKAVIGAFLIALYHLSKLTSLWTSQHYSYRSVPLMFFLILSFVLCILKSGKFATSIFRYTTSVVLESFLIELLEFDFWVLTCCTVFPDFIDLPCAFYKFQAIWLYFFSLTSKGLHLWHTASMPKRFVDAKRSCFVFSYNSHHFYFHK